MRKFIVLAALAALVALFVAGALSSAVGRMSGPSWIELERERLAVERAQAVAPVQTFAAQALALAPVVTVYALIILGAAGGALALARFRLLARPDERGLLPVEVERLGDYSGQALGAFHAAQLAAASRQPVPHSLTYSPHSTYHHRADAGGVPLLPADVAASVAEVPSFAQLLDRGEIGQGRPMLLGYDEHGAAMPGSWLDLYSCAVGGLGGTGKTWTATYLAAQAALYGTRFVILDPHAGDADSLAQRLGPMRARFVCDTAESPAEMLAAVELVRDELERRKKRGRGPGWVFICDEFSALQRGALAEPLAELVEALGQEGRKLGLYAMVCGQVWNAARAGGTELRDSLASAYVHRLRPSQARMLTGLTAADLPHDLLELPRGTAYLLDTRGELRRVTIPHMAAGDVQRVAGLLDDGADSMIDLGQSRAGSGENTPRAARSWPGAGPATAPLGESGASAAGRATPLDADAATLLARYVGGATLHDLAAARAGTTNPSARAYKEARQAVEQLLRNATARALGAE